VPSAEASAPVVGAPTSSAEVPTEPKPRASATAPETLAPVLVSPPPVAPTRKGEGFSERSAGRTKKTRRTHVTEEHTVTRTRRRTGPGGIYIPPPSQWFR
jgi:hypothetical protein